MTGNATSTRRRGLFAHGHLIRLIALATTLACALTLAATSPTLAAAGDVAWTSRLVPEGSATNVATGMVLSPDGSRIYTTGYIGGGDSGLDYFTAARDADTGKVLWSARLEDPGIDRAEALEVSPDGSRVFVTGSADIPPYGGRQYLTVAYDADDGAELWRAGWKGPNVGELASGYDYAIEVAVSPDGSKVFVTGEGTREDWDTDVSTVAYDAKDGTELWQVWHSGDPGRVDRARAMAVSTDGQLVYVAGDIADGFHDYFTIAYDTDTGDVVWEAREGRQSSDVPIGIAVAPDALFVTGTSTNPFDRPRSDYLTVAYDPNTGERLWRSLYARGDSEASAIALSPDRSTVYVTGASDVGSRDFESSRLEDVATVAYDAGSGEQLWAHHYDHNQNSEHAYFGAGYGVTVSPDGSRIHVISATKRKRGLGDFDMLTLTYDTAGGLRWIADYDGPLSGHDVPRAVATNGDLVFVTGSDENRSVGLDHESSYMTIAYDPARCTDGTYEDGMVSDPLHRTVEPAAGPAGGTVHTVNCLAVAPNDPAQPRPTLP